LGRAWFGFTKTGAGLLKNGVVLAKQSTAQLGLRELLGPCSASLFFRSYWGKQVLSIERNDPNFYVGLPTLSDFEFLVSTLSAPQDGWFSLVKGHAERPPNSALTRDGTLNLRNVYEAVGSGYSLRLSKLHRRHIMTGRLCRHIEAYLAMQGVLVSRPVGANAYFTPTSAQGLAPHYDDHDVFILQLAGRKTWRIFDRVIDSPVEPPIRALTAEETGEPLNEVVLSPGDLVYLPRGFAHEALTMDDLSLHLTISIYPATWRDLFAAILDSDPCFRRNLPRHFASSGQPRAGDLKKLRALANSMPRSTAFATAAREILRRSLTKSDLPPRSGALQEIAGLGELDAQSRGQLAEGGQAHVEMNRASAVLLLPGASLQGSCNLESTFRMIALGNEFRVGDLPLVTDEADKLKLASDLLRAGFICRCP
jgi:ribosomal protein L16 Arg81 hydroxylase